MACLVQVRCPVTFLPLLPELGATTTAKHHSILDDASNIENVCV